VYFANLEAKSAQSMKHINRYIEHSALKPTLIDADVEKLVAEAKVNDFFGVCVPPFWVKKTKREIGNSDIQLVTVVGFPLGYNLTETKIEEIRHVIANGADELDIVMNVSAFKAGMTWPKIELAKCATLIHDHEKIMKVIIETAYLSEEEIVKASMMCRDAGADFVKTSTGFAPEGAKEEHIKLMRESLPSNIGVKASGGIRDYETAVKMIKAGADRLGVSAGVEIVKEARGETSRNDGKSDY
jgi:deoxyribose-phosphate aldolase